MKAWTDYPILALGDISGRRAPIRAVDVLSWDGDKYCAVRAPGVDAVQHIKRGYIYWRRGRFGDVPCVGAKRLNRLNGGDR